MVDNGTVKILCVDDEESILKAFQRTFLDEDYQILTARSGSEGLEVMEQEGPIPLVISDYRMPGMNGVEFLREVYRTWPDSIRIIFSGYADTAAVVEAINEGRIYKFIPKPWNHQELKVNIANALERYRLTLSNRRLTEELQVINAKLQQWNESLEQQVTERTLQLLQQKRLLEKIIANIPYHVFWKNTDARYLGANPSFARSRGVSDGEELFGKTDEELVGQGAQAGEMQALEEQVLESREPVIDRELVFTTGSGRTATYLVSRVPLRGSRGEVVGLLGINKDITGRKASEEALRQSEAKFRDLSQQFQVLLDAIPGSLLLLSPEREIIWANRQAARRLGDAEALTLKGRRCHELWHERSHPCDSCPVERCFAEGGPVEEMITAPDGRIWGVKAFPLLDGEGAVSSVIELAFDITEKIALREESRRLGQLASLGELAAGVAHEINNPNALILVNAPILQQAWEGACAILEQHYREHGDFPLGRLPYSRLREELPLMGSEIVESAEQIRDIVGDLRDFVHQEEPDLSQPLDLNHTTQAAVRLVANTLKQATDRFSAEYGLDLPRSRGCPHQIEQVVVNLLLNASQALPDRKRGITLTTRMADERRALEVVVEDEGGGIDPAELPRITDPFFTTRRAEGGTGLGLAVCDRIVRAHGGSLLFESEQGQGTRAILQLPLDFGAGVP